MKIEIPHFKTTILSAIVFVLLFCMTETAKAQLTIKSEHANLLKCDTMTRGIFIVWWDKDFKYGSKASVMLDSMLSYRKTCLNKLKMQDPSSPSKGYYCNIYIHTPGNDLDIFKPNGWVNGMAHDVNGLPFLALPNYLINDWKNTSHETFHLFQANSWNQTPGFQYSGDSQWYTEATAEWFAAKQNPNIPRTFANNEILLRIPHVPLWLGFYNRPSTYPNNWQRNVHQYALNAFLYYLTDVAGVADTLLTKGFYSGTSKMPQKYLSDALGESVFRNHFANWAARMTNRCDFIKPFQISVSDNEWKNQAEILDDNKFVKIYKNEGSGGWFRPENAKTTCAWAFNTYKLFNNTKANCTFEINGDRIGSFGTNAHFQGRVLVQNSMSGAKFHNLAMNNDYQGKLTLSLTPNDTSIYFIVASMPNVYTDANPTFQLFSYEMRIDLDKLTNLTTSKTSSEKKEIARFNILGKKIEKNIGGMQIILYNDGTSQKIFVAQ